MKWTATSTRRCSGLLACLLGLCLLPGAATAATAGALAGAKSVVLEIDGVDEDLSAHGLSRKGLEQELTRRLEGAGVEVIPGSELGRDGAAVLRFRVRLVRTLYYFYLYNVNLTLNSKVALQGGNAFTTLPTWSDGWTGSLQPTDVGLIGRYAGDLLDRFLAARAGESAP